MKSSLAILSLCLVLPSASFAAGVSFQGFFATDDQVNLFHFSIASDTTISIQSWGYGGGVNAASATINAGGFDSFLTLFDVDGSQVNLDDNGCGAANFYGGVCLDAYLSAALPSGSYVLALTEAGNGPVGSLSDGFAQQGTGDFTCAGGFCDNFGGQDDGHWALDITGADEADEVSAPEPVSALLGLAGLAWLLSASQAKQARRHKQGEVR